MSSHIRPSPPRCGGYRPHAPPRARSRPHPSRPRASTVGKLFSDAPNRARASHRHRARRHRVVSRDAPRPRHPPRASLASGTTREARRERRRGGRRVTRRCVFTSSRSRVVSSRSRVRVPRASLAQDSDVDATRRFFANVSIDGWIDGAGSRWRGTHRPVVNPRCMYGSMGRGRRGRTTGRVARCGAVQCVM